jgi:uncharacterized protein YuzE
MAATVAQSTEEIVGKCAAMVHDVLQLPARNVWIDYDEEADVLYMSLRKPQRTTKTVEVDKDILVRKDGRSVVGVTIMNASTRR